ncbi:Phosphatidylethanolamine-binding protein 2 [Thelohanellus kitauei]|uniref:Phosphatidylethanolamine-binding protein 2 n=1 Tax=Thelohanellus kitauei TaxID=669202 RepID=A0A0C2MUK3_THEKT|nr:Phosphatidylethanolamine-binding protein 2 [Thelohanellus kitauei]
MLDIDANVDNDPINRETYQMLAINVKGIDLVTGDLHTGDMWFEYTPQTPAQGAGFFRLVALAFEQSDVIELDEPKRSEMEGRTERNTKAFAKQYGLKGPVAAGYMEIINP